MAGQARDRVANGRARIHQTIRVIPAIEAGFRKRSKLRVALGIIAAACLLGAYVVIAYGIDKLVLTLSNWLTSPQVPRLFR
jgi:hypothetical protein